MRSTSRLPSQRCLRGMLINLWVHVMNVWTCSVPQVLCLMSKIFSVTRIDEIFVESSANSNWFSTWTVAPLWPNKINDSSKVFWHSECANFQRCSIIDNSADDWPNFLCIQTSYSQEEVFKSIPVYATSLQESESTDVCPIWCQKLRMFFTEENGTPFQPIQKIRAMPLDHPDP